MTHDDGGERRDRPDDRQQPVDAQPERPPAAPQPAREPGRRCGLVLGLGLGRGLRPEDGERHRRVGGLVVERLLLREHRLQVGLLGVDLVLDAEQPADVSGVLEQRPQLGDRRLVGGDPAAHIGDLLGDVLRLLAQVKLGAEPGSGQLAQRGLVVGGRDLERDARARRRGRLAGAAVAVLGRHVPAGRRHDRRGPRQRGGDVTRAHGELGGVDELLVAGGEPGGGIGLRLAARFARAGSVPAAAAARRREAGTAAAPCIRAVRGAGSRCAAAPLLTGAA